jgi:hypothetical protein
VFKDSPVRINNQDGSPHVHPELVHHPAHYGGDVTHETYKCLAAWGLVSNAYLWTAVKYLSRAGKKDPSKTIEDLEKSKWYIDREIERLKAAEK